MADFTNQSSGQTFLVHNVETIRGLVFPRRKPPASYRGVDCGQQPLCSYRLELGVALALQATPVFPSTQLAPSLWGSGGSKASLRNATTPSTRIHGERPTLVSL